MRTTLVVDDAFFPDLKATTRARTKTEAVRVALKEYLRLKHKEALLAKRGKLELDDDLEDARALDTHEASDH